MRLKNNYLIVISKTTFIILIYFMFANFSEVRMQTNLVEEENDFKIYVGTYYNLIIPKKTGPQLEFDVINFGKLLLKVNFISEYFGPTDYLSSLKYLGGKGYSFERLNWNVFGSSETNKTFVNKTRTNLERNTTISFSYQVFNYNTSINNLNITALKNTYIEMRIINWTYSANARGIAINVESLLEEPEEYQRLGPYINIENYQFNAEIRGKNYNFKLIYNSIIDAITRDGEKEQLFINSFANYNIAYLEKNKPLDFWISIPFEENLEQIIISFTTSFIPLSNDAGINSISILLGSITFLFISFRIISKKRRKSEQ